MDELIEEIEFLMHDYSVQTSELPIILAIESFADLRSYPESWSAERKLEDMKKNKAKIAMAAIEIDSKNGAENQLSHSENGTSRGYADCIMAYKGVIGFANTI